jgi:hypothetical protein
MKSFISQVDNSTQTLSLESELEKLALESNAIANVIDTFKNVIPRLSAKIDGLIKDLASPSNSQVVKETETAFKELNKKLGYAEYVTYSKTVVSVPEGFEGNLLEYLKLLEKLAPEVYNSVNDTLAEYKAMLSVFLTNKDAKLSMKDDTDMFDKVSKHRLKIVAELAVYFPTDSAKSKAYLGDTIHRFADIAELVHTTKTLDKLSEAQSLFRMSEKVRECVDLLNLITTNINDGSVAKVSGKASMNISTGAYEIAKYVELVSVFRFKTMQAIASVNKLIVQLDDIL